jgi:hypothetical protein
MRYGDDPRCIERSIRIEGFDVCELLELNMGGRGWRVSTFPEFNCIHHGGGSGYHNNEEIAKFIKHRAIHTLKEFNIQAIHIERE